MIEFEFETIKLSFLKPKSITFGIFIELNCKKTSIIVRPTQYEKLIMNITDTDFDNVIFNGNFVINFVSRLMDVISPTLRPFYT